ncbi:MAG TPA: hypothetical protein VGK50_08900 [Coriobacteriia bacterium]|jgi:hypothetical protein
MKKRTGIALVVAGLVAGLALGTLGIASAVTASTAASQTAPRWAGGPGSGRGMRGGMMGGSGGLAGAVASLTGSSIQDVMTQRQSGKSFAEIAQAKGVSAEQVVSAALRTATANLKTRLESEVSTTALPGAGRGMGMRGGFGGPPPDAPAGN